MLNEIIVLTQESFDNQEHIWIDKLFDAGLNCLHIRKPKSSIKQMEELLEKINKEHHFKIVIHQHHHLITKYNLKGIHLSSKFRTQSRFFNVETLILASKVKGKTVSTSIHSTVELRLVNGIYDYCFLSPVFDSISKQGYKGRYEFFLDLKEYKRKETKVYALGGVCNENVIKLKHTDFDGFAVMGYLWESKNPVEAFLELKNSINEWSVQ